jgi:D-glycerate 3-kinase
MLARRVATWVMDRSGEPGRTCVLGISGPQGCGKSTLAATTCTELRDRGWRAASVSIDDFYLTHAEQQTLAADHTGNPYLAVRGYPGTHDIALGEHVIDALRSADGPVRHPTYDKGAHDGQGDRAAEWIEVQAPLDVLIVEGWMLGFVPVDPETLEDADLRSPNALLEGYAGWTQRLDALVHLDATDPGFVLDWRMDAERARRECFGRGLTDAQALAYVRRFLPAYATWNPGLRERWPITGPCWRIPIGHDRNAID